MTEDEAVAALDAMQAGDDEEWAHGEAEEIVMRFLRAKGLQRVADAFESARDRVGFWYA